MRPKTAILVVAVVAAVALVVGLTRPELAEANREEDGPVVRAGNAVVDGPDARIEGGPAVAGAEATAGGQTAVAGGGSGDEKATEGEGGAPVPKGEVAIRMRGDEGVQFSGTCSVGGEEREIRGQVPKDLTFTLDGGELECEIRKEGEGTLKISVVSDNDHVVQKMSGDGTMKLTYSDNGVSSSTTSASGSSNVVQSSSSSSSVVQSNSSTSR